MSQTETSPKGHKRTKCPKQKRPQKDKIVGSEKNEKNRNYISRTRRV